MESHQISKCIISDSKLKKGFHYIMGCMSSKYESNNPMKRSSNPGNEELHILAAETSFNLNEVEALYVLYENLSSSIVKSGLINKEVFQLALLGNCRKQSLFVDRVFNMFDLNCDGVIGFKDFARSLSIFHPRTPYEDKIAFTFNLYDLRNTGYIEREELKEMVLAILQEIDVTLSDNLIETILDKSFMDADFKKDGKIDQEEWREFVLQNPSLIKNMTLPYLKDLTTTFPSFLFSTEVHDSDLTAVADGYSLEAS